MTPIRWAVLAALVAALVALQAGVLDRLPEKIAEDRHTRIADLPPSDMVPTYIASLFFGSFRAIAIDALWIQLKRVEDEKRWRERREILRFISYLQPRNEEVWANLGWHSAFNVANSFSDKDRSWEWVRFGLGWLREGNTKLPYSPHLKHELAWTLFFKPTWSSGRLDVDLLRRVEEDAALQELLQDKKPVERPLSALELAILWYGKCRDELLTLPDQRFKTQTGMWIYPHTCDGFIRRAMYFQGMYEWRHKDRPDAAKEWFRRAERQAGDMVAKYPAEAFYAVEVVPFYRGLPEIVDLEKRARDGRAEDEFALLVALQKLMTLEGPGAPPDEGFLWLQFDERELERHRGALLNKYKQKFARGQDVQECNDDWRMATDTRPGHMVTASLDPQGFDTDFYLIDVVPTQNGPPRPAPLKFQFSRPDASKIDLKVTILDYYQKPLGVTQIRGRQEAAFQPPVYGRYFLKVEPFGTPDPWPADTRYSLLYNSGP